MKRYNKRRLAQEEAALDLTPMMDIVFIMLIFFIVTTSFVKETGVDVNRPNAETAERDEKGNILVAITENDEIWIDKRRVDLKAVRANIEIFGFSKEYQEHFAAKPELNTKYGWDQLEHISIFARFSKRVISFTRGRARIRYRGKTKSVARAPQHCTIHNATNFTIYPQ